VNYQNRIRGGIGGQPASANLGEIFIEHERLSRDQRLPVDRRLAYEQAAIAVLQADLSIRRATLGIYVEGCYQ
jgi:hypothetical protein